MQARRIWNCALAGMVLAIWPGLNPGELTAADHAQSGEEKHAENERDTATEFRAFDGFDEKLELNWKPVRHDPTHVSLTKRPGTLTITTQRGSIHRDSEQDATSEGTRARNIFLIENPSSNGGAFVVTTRVESFSPETFWQQAGLIVYNDDDNYLRWDLEWNSQAPAGVVLVLLRETNQKSDWSSLEPKPSSKGFWLRITKRGSYYQYAHSTDGKKYTVAGEKIWGDGTPKWVGIYAKNGGNPDASDVDAYFDFFEVRSLTSAEKNDPVYLERQKLLGTWEVVSCRLNGKPLEKTPLSRFVFTGTEVTVTEGTETLQTEYTLDVTKKPRQLVMSALSGRAGESVSAIYAWEADALVICLNLRPGDPTPTELESKKGDGRMLLTLRRVKEKE